MEKNDKTGPDRDLLLTRAHVEQVLQRAGLDERQIAAVLDGVEFPSPISRISTKLMQNGISYSALTDQMGGSP